jgi:acetoacetyl-CoA synthetase
MPLWEPSADILAKSPMALFMKAAGAKAGRDFRTYDDLHAWSVEDRAAFWTAVWDECGAVGEKGGIALENGERMLEARFFPEGRLNFAENLLKKAGPGDAIVFRGEDKVSYRWSWDDLRARVSKLQQAFAAMGIGEGDRVAAMMPNMPETIALMLAAAALGAIGSSC